MYLKKLEMQGFKSFVDKISLDFGSGITAIVGPNGSGKSNISDAIRWVLGEQSVKSLRGSKMEDVIFAGTEKRKPTGFAEVSLTLDNSEKIFNIDYEEITVTRRVYRSGESEYFINKAICRLRDINELFMDTGLGKDGYSIIGQGKIDTIVSGKPEDRRKIFEEAAGISKFKYKKIQAENKLSQTQDNLERVLDIAGELESRIGPLKRQSEKAGEYIKLRDQLRQLDINLYVEKITSLTKKINDLNQNFTALTAEAEKETTLYNEYQQKEETYYKSQEETEEKLSSLRDLLHKTDIYKTELSGRISLLQNNIKSYLEQISDFEREIESVNSLASSDEKKTEEVLKEVENLNEKKTSLMSSIDDINRLINQISEEIDEKNALLQKTMQLHSDKLREIDSLEAKIETIEALDQNYDERLSSLQNSLQNATMQRDEAKEKFDEFESQIKEKKLFQEETLLKNKTTEEECEKKKELVSKLKEEYNSFSDEYNKKLSRLNILLDMEKNLDGFGHGVKMLFKGDFAKSIDIHGVYSKLIKTDEKYFTAVEVSLGNALSNVVVATDADAKAAISHLKKNNLGRVTFLPLESVKGKRGSFESDLEGEAGYLGLICDKIDCDSIYREITESLLGQTALFDNIDNALKCAHKFGNKIKMVTLGGEMLHPGGSISGGSAPKNSGLLGRESEIEKLEEICQKLENDMDSTDERIDDEICRIKALTEKIGEGSELLRKTGEEILKLIGLREVQSHMLSREESEVAKLSKELETIIEAEKNADSEKERISKLIEAEKKNCEKISADTENIRRDIGETIRKRENKNGRIIEIRMDISSINSQLELCNMKKQTISEQEIARKEQINKLNDSISQTNNRIVEAENTIKVIEQNINENESFIKGYQEQIDAIMAQRAESDKDNFELKEKIKLQNEKLNNLKINLARLEDTMSQTEQRLDDTIQRLWSEYDIGFTEAQKHATDMDDIKEAEKTAASLKAKIRALGSINTDAIEEYKEVSERYEFLSKQIEDLTKSKDELTSLIKDTVKNMNTRFISEFENINQNFANVFRELFGGGSASLSLTDPSNIAETGVEISVRPPGKKLQRLSLLSGGEMALCAIAILFAILKVRPTPFCILDEIEAALDDNNIQRFCNYIKNFSNTTQFIVVTHRRGTMEAADILYGVTMQEKGISKLLSMRPDEVETEK